VPCEPELPEAWVQPPLFRSDMSIACLNRMSARLVAGIATLNMDHSRPEKLVTLLADWRGPSNSKGGQIYATGTINACTASCNHFYAERVWQRMGRRSRQRVSGRANRLLRYYPMLRRTTQESYRPRVSNRTMVGNSAIVMLVSFKKRMGAVTTRE
jgi:hypothetical protein